MKYILMPLDNPTTFEKAIAFIKTPKGVRVLLYAVAGLVVLGAVLFTVSKVSTWWGGRQIDKLKANVNGAVVELQKAQSNISAAKQDEQKALQNVNVAVADYTEKMNATDHAKSETDRAMQGLANAVNANRNIGITVNELEKRLGEVPE